MIMDAEEIRKRHKNAEDPEEHISILAQLNGCDDGTIKEILFGGDCDNMKPQWDEEKARALYDMGLSDGGITKKLGIENSSTIYRWRKRNGLPANNAYSGGWGSKKEKETPPAAVKNSRVQQQRETPLPWYHRINVVLETASATDVPETKELYGALALELFKKDVDVFLHGTEGKTL